MLDLETASSFPFGKWKQSREWNFGSETPKFSEPSCSNQQHSESSGSCSDIGLRKGVWVLAMRPPALLPHLSVLVKSRDFSSGAMGRRPETYLHKQGCFAPWRWRPSLATWGPRAHASSMPSWLLRDWVLALMQGWCMPCDPDSLGQYSKGLLKAKEWLKPANI